MGKPVTILNPTTNTQVDIAALFDAINAMAGIDRDALGEVLGRFNCGEADALASVLAVAGHAGPAAEWVEGHAAGDDDEEDRHADIYAAQQEAGGLLGEDESMALSAEYAGTLV